MDFYRDAFGAELLPGDTPITCPCLQLGNLTLTLLQNTDKESPLEFSQHAMITLLLEVDDLKAAFDRAIKCGARVIEPPDAGGVTFMVSDPDGIIIEVMQYDPDV
jgi:uncharacterized glyoxalase superfamily protein PhnB